MLLPQYDCQKSLLQALLLLPIQALKLLQNVRGQHAQLSLQHDRLWQCSSSYTITAHQA
jgi:hypothetical protein